MVYRFGKIMRIRSMFAIFVFGLSVLSAQDLSGILGSISKQAEKNAKVTGIRFNCEPKECKVRPLESLIIQVLVDGEIPQGSGDPKKGRLRRTPGPLKVIEKDGGWVSKPFKYQGTDPGGFADSGGSVLSSILLKGAGDYVVQDAFLYTAPETAGTYTIENETEGSKAKLTVTVASDAPSTRKAEVSSFGTEDRTSETYRALAEHYAPMLAQETWFQPKSDYITRFDFDGDLIGDNNWDDLEKGTSQAYVYYAVMETGTHWFLIYNAFHPRDYSDKCVAGSCHENDNEGLILTVQKDGSEFGKLLVMETLAHNNVYSYVADSSIRNGAQNIDGKIDLFENSHPVVFVESGGHGIVGASQAPHSRYKVQSEEFVSGTGVTYIYKGTAERPRHPNDRKVGYELLPILTHWWPRANSDQDQRMFDAFQPYQPFGGRPGVKYPRIGTTFWGRKESSNKAKPFWGWHDNNTLKNKILAVGQWALDPAYSVSRELTFPASMKFSLDYTHNPYLGIGDANVTPAGSTLTQSPVVISPGTPAIGAPSTTETSQPASILPNLTPAASTPDPAPATPSIPEIREGWIEVEAVVDGSAVFHFWGRDATPEVLSGQPIKDQKVQVNAPLPEAGSFSCALEKKSGRGEVKLVDQPSEANGFTANVRIDDPSKGAGKYVFRLKWTRR